MTRALKHWGQFYAHIHKKKYLKIVLQHNSVSFMAIYPFWVQDTQTSSKQQISVERESMRMEVQLIWASWLVLMVFRRAGPVWLKHESIFWKIPFTAVEVRVQDRHQLRPLEPCTMGGVSFGLQQRLEINAPLPEINMSGLSFSWRDAWRTCVNRT